MSDPTFVETWVCLVRPTKSRVPLAIDEQMLRTLAAQFRVPMPVDVNFRSFEAHGLPVPPSGAQIISVEVRYDEQGAYLAGLFRSPFVTVAIHTDRRDPMTGVPLPPRISAVSFTNAPVEPAQDSEV